MKRLLILAPLLLLAACNEPKVEPMVPTITLPDGLKDCTFYEVRLVQDGPVLKIARCPNSTTSSTYAVGKGVGTTVTVDTPTPMSPARAALLDKVSKDADAAEIRKAARQRALEKLTETDMKALGLL